MTQDVDPLSKHKNYYVQAELLSNGENPPILAFICGICKERMKYYMYFDQVDTDDMKQKFRLRCPNEHYTDVEILTNGR